MTTRATLPQEFMDITSALMLVAPQPQFFYAAMWLQAVNGQLNLQNAMRSGIDLIGRSAIATKGELLDSFERNQLMLEPDPIVGANITSAVKLGEKAGHILRLNRPIFKSTTYTEASREISANSSISTTTIPVQSGQTALTLRRFGGPYDQDNSRVAPIGVDAFDSTFAMHNIANVVGQNLHQDCMKFIDTAFATLLDNSTNVVRPTGFSADDDSVDQDDAPFDTDVLERTNLALDNAKVPVGPDGRRTMVLHPQQIYQLQRDPRLVRLTQENTVMNPLLVKSYKFCTAHFNVFQSSSLRTSTNSSSKTIYKGHAFGPGVLGTGVGMLPEVRQSTDDNYGETGKVIWLGYMGFGLIDASFGAVIKTS